MGSITATTCTEVAAAISARDPSFFAHNKLGPKTIAMLLGVILLTSLFWASLAKNLIKYLKLTR